MSKRPRNQLQIVANNDLNDEVWEREGKDNQLAMEADMWEQCSSCVHFRGSFEKEEPSCAAFPLGIPKEIWEGDFDHNNPFEGDLGIMFNATVEED